MAEASRRSHGHVRWFDERLGESPAWAQFTKNTFIDIDPDEDDVEDKSAYRRQRSAPARALGLKPTSRMSPQEHAEMLEAARIAVSGTSAWAHISQSLLVERCRIGNIRSSHKGCRSSGPSSRCSSRSGRSSGPSSRRSSVCPKSKRRQSKRRTAFPIMLTNSKPGRPSSRRSSGISSGISSGPSSRRSSVISSAPSSRRNSGSNSVASSRPGSRHSCCSAKSQLSAKRLTSGRTSKKPTNKGASKHEAAEQENTEAESSESEESDDEEPVARKRRERMSAVVWTRMNDQPRQQQVKVANRFAALEDDTFANAPDADTQSSNVNMDLDQVQQVEDIPVASDQAESEVASVTENAVDIEQAPVEEMLQHESKGEDLAIVKDELPEEPHTECTNADCTSDETAKPQDDITTDAVHVGEESTLAKEEPTQLSKHARKRAQKKLRKVGLQAADEESKVEASVQLENKSQSCDAKKETATHPEPTGNSDSQSGELTQHQSQMLAQLAMRLNEQNIALHLRACSARRLLLATPVNPLTKSCDEMLEVEPGDVIHCEISDASGWGFGTIVAPLRLSGKRGCFRCDSMCPITVEVRSNRDGETLEFVPGRWAEVAVSQSGNTKNRLREKAALNRVRLAQRAWEIKYGK